MVGTRRVWRRASCPTVPELAGADTQGVSSAVGLADSTGDVPVSPGSARLGWLETPPEEGSPVMVQPALSTFTVRITPVARSPPASPGVDSRANVKQASADFRGMTRRSPSPLLQQPAGRRLRQRWSARLPSVGAGGLLAGLRRQLV